MAAAPSRFENPVLTKTELLLQAAETSYSAMLLSETIPDVAAELAEALLREGRPELAAQVAGLRLAGRCRCGDSFCASFATEIVDPWPDSAERIIAPMRGLSCAFAVEGRIVYVELLDRQEVRAHLLELLP